MQVLQGDSAWAQLDIPVGRHFSDVCFGVKHTQGKQLLKMLIFQFLYSLFPLISIPASTAVLLFTEKNKQTKKNILDLLNQYAAGMLWTNNCSKAHTSS